MSSEFLCSAGKSSHAARVLKLLWDDSKVKGVKSQTTDTVDILLLVCTIAKPTQFLEKLGSFVSCIFLCCKKKTTEVTEGLLWNCFQFNSNLYISFFSKIMI